MIIKKDKLEVPFEDRTFIDYQLRIDLFPNLIENLKVYMPNMELIFAYLNRDVNVNIDYFIILYDKERDRILWDIAYLYSNRAMPGYLYAIKNNLYKEFFDTIKDHICSTNSSKFSEFITMGCGLSMDKNKENYWKDPKNINTFIDNLTELSNAHIR